MKLINPKSLYAVNREDASDNVLVSPPGRDSRDSHSSRLAEATEKALGTITLFKLFPVYVSGLFLTFIQHLQNCFFNY